MAISIGNIIAKKRKELGFTQQYLAEYLNVSFQAVSKWETGSAYPDISLLPQIATVLQTSIDALVGYKSLPQTVYEDKYKNDDYYWGIVPNSLCYEIMKLKPPVKPYRVLDIGCGEGKDAVFLAKNGYDVTAFDVAESGLEKACRLADKNNVSVNFFKADIRDVRLSEEYDIIYSSGVFHYLSPELRKSFIDSLKEHTAYKGINAVNVFVEKPFIPKAPDLEEKELSVEAWHSGELFTYYHDWLFHKNDEIIFPCNSGGVPHKHCMDVLIAEKR